MRVSDFNLFENLLEFVKLIDEKKQHHVALFVIFFILELLWFLFTKEEYSRLQLNKATDAFILLVASTIHILVIAILLFCVIRIVKPKEIEKIKEQEKSKEETETTKPLILGHKETLISSIEDFILSIGVLKKSKPITEEKIRWRIENLASFLGGAKVDKNIEDEINNLVVGCKDALDNSFGLIPLGTTEKLLEETSKLEEKAKKILKKLKEVPSKT